MEKNEGIINSGNITATNIATGANASITTVASGDPNLQQLMPLLEQLLSAVSSTKENVPGKEDIISSVTTLKEEVKKEKPSHITLKSIGSAILENLKYVKDIAPIAESIWHHISAFIAR